MHPDRFAPRADLVTSPWDRPESWDGTPSAMPDPWSDAPPEQPTCSAFPSYAETTDDDLRRHMLGCWHCRFRVEPTCPVGLRIIIDYQHCIHKRARGERAQFWDLVHAGWKFFPQDDDDEIWAWHWRSPARREGLKGRPYKSTESAWRAMQRAGG